MLEENILIIIQTAINPSEIKQLTKIKERLLDMSYKRLLLLLIVIIQKCQKKMNILTRMGNEDLTKYLETEYKFDCNAVSVFKSLKVYLKLKSHILMKLTKNYKKLQNQY